MAEEKPEKVQATPEEIKKRRAELIKHYDDQIEFLKTQIKYENLLTEIEESRMKRAMAIMRQAQIYAGPETESEPKPETKSEMVQPEERVPQESPRKLKVEKPA